MDIKVNKFAMLSNQLVNNQSEDQSQISWRSEYSQRNSFILEGYNNLVPFFFKRGKKKRSIMLFKKFLNYNLSDTESHNLKWTGMKSLFVQNTPYMNLSPLWKKRWQKQQTYKIVPIKASVKKRHLASWILKDIKDGSQSSGKFIEAWVKCLIKHKKNNDWIIKQRDEFYENGQHSWRYRFFRNVYHNFKIKMVDSKTNRVSYKRQKVKKQLWFYRYRFSAIPKYFRKVLRLHRHFNLKFLMLNFKAKGIYIHQFKYLNLMKRTKRILNKVGHNPVIKKNIVYRNKVQSINRSFSNYRTSRTYRTKKN